MARPRKFDRNVAFEFWYNEPFNRRRRIDVANHFGVSTVSINQVMKMEDWERRALERDTSVRRETEKKLVKSHAERMLDNLKVIDALKAKFARQLLPNSAFEVQGLTPKEYLEVLRTELLLLGNPTEITAQGSARSLADLEAEISDMSDADIARELEIMEKVGVDDSAGR